MRCDGSCSCDVPSCAAQVSGDVAEVAQQLAGGRWCRLRLEAIGESRWASLCEPHARAIGHGQRGALVVGRKGWTDDIGMMRSLVLAETAAECAATKCPATSAAGEASAWSELRLETVALPGASYVCRLCPVHATALLAGTRLSLSAERWTEDAATTRAIAAALTER